MRRDCLPGPDRAKASPVKTQARSSRLKMPYSLLMCPLNGTQFMVRSVVSEGDGSSV